MVKQAVKAQEGRVAEAALELGKRVALYATARRKLEACEQRLICAQQDYEWEVQELKEMQREVR